MTPLHYAAKNGHREVCMFILENADEMNTTYNHGKTPLYYAGLYGGTFILAQIMVTNK